MSGKQLGSQTGGSIIDRDIEFYSGEGERCRMALMQCPVEDEKLWRARMSSANALAHALVAYRAVLNVAPTGDTSGLRTGGT